MDKKANIVIPIISTFLVKIDFKINVSLEKLSKSDFSRKGSNPDNVIDQDLS